MPPKKQKGQKMGLNEFFADTNEMESLPTAPAARDPTAPRRGEPGYLDSMPDRSQRTFAGAPEPRADAPLPTAPPYTAFVGNLVFEIEEAELRDFFGDLSPTSVRLVKDPMGKTKGFAYVEFADLDGLKGALDRNYAQLAGRAIRVNVAESTSAPRRDFGPSAADEASQWRRSGPLPAREAPAPRRGSSFASAGAGDDRDWSTARGAKFAPAPPGAGGAGGGFSRESSGYGRPRGEFGAEGGLGREPREPSHADEAGQWRSARPMVEAKPVERQGGREAPPHRPAGPADSDATVRSPVSTPPAESSPAMPASRQRLNLLPRSSAPASPDADAAEAPAKASPFGAARPVDSASRDAAAASKIATADEARRAAEAKAAAERERREAERQARDERARKERDEARAAAPKRVHPSRQPAPEPAPAPAKDEDGFEVATAGRKRGGNQAPVTLEKPVAKGFSFAAAADAMQGEGGEGGDGAEAELAEGVERVEL